MAGFCGKAGPLGDRTPGCAVTCSCLVSGRLRQSWGKTQPLPGVVLREKNLFTDAESLFLCEVPPAHSVLFPELTGSSSAAAGAPPGRVPGWLCIAWLHLLAQPACGGTPRGTQPPAMWLCWSPALPWPPAQLAPSPAETPTPGSAAQHDPATFQPRHTPVSPQKLIHLRGAPSPLTWTMQGLEHERVSFSFLSALLYNPLLGTGSGCQIASYICSFPNAPLLGANEGLIIGCKYVVTLGK